VGCFWQLVCINYPKVHRVIHRMYICYNNDMASALFFINSFVKQNPILDDEELLRTFRRQYPTVNAIFDALGYEKLDMVIHYDFFDNDEVPHLLAMQKPVVLAMRGYPKGVYIWIDEDVQFPDLQTKKQFVNGFLHVGYLVREIIRNIKLLEVKNYEDTINQ